jgi:hypothetical protein
VHEQSGRAFNGFLDLLPRWVVADLLRVGIERRDELTRQWVAAFRVARTPGAEDINP